MSCGKRIKMHSILTLCFLTALFATTTRARHVLTQHGGLPLPDNLLRPSRVSKYPVDGTSCASWQFGVETNSVRDWDLVPSSCKEYVGNYMLGDGYHEDSITVVSEAITYAEKVELQGDGKDVWVFDVDDTAVSTLPFNSQYGFGADPFNSTAYKEWQAEGSAPPLSETLKLYNKFLSLGIKAVFITGRKNKLALREATERNLKNVGYYTWEKVVLKEENASRISYKSGERQKLVDEGYKIVGNIGDQWGDLLGSPEGDRTFKLPNPMYYSG